MKERTTVTTSKQVSEMDQNVLRAVYALNMCTVSVSQIIDYNDTYILEQEYEAILNNLNLEKMPKADALKKILIELLNTITFFRIHEIKKTEIEKKYQKKVKNAIWSAVPNLNMIVAGNPAAIAFSIASQVGIGYMNYRKEKNNAVTEKEKEELELKITAIEQFHALRRELFTTAWELAEEYEFDDRLRLTEKQIKQYNQILMDRNELRKYVRLEAIKDKFEAFPPFWYNFGHTACFIAGDSMLPLEDWEREYYRTKAKEHFSHYEMLNKFNILREDQMTCAFALEYADLLLLEEKRENKDKIAGLISIADNMSGTALDIKQLCAISYLKIGETDKAAELLKQLVNEEYNTITNAKLLSRIYVSQFLKGNSKTAKFDYKNLQLRLGTGNSDYLFPMPEKVIDDDKLQKEYLVDTKILLQMDYRSAIRKFLHKYTVLFNAVIPAPYGYEKEEEYYGYTEKAIQNRIEDIKKVLNDKDNCSSYLEKLAEAGFRFQFVDLLNEAMKACDELDIWRNSKDHDYDVKSVRANLVQKKPLMKEIQDKMNTKTFSCDTYSKLQSELSFKAFMGTMLDDLRDVVMNSIDSMISMEEIEKADYNLVEFCRKQGISLNDSHGSNESVVRETPVYLDYAVLGKDGVNEQQRNNCINRMKELVKSAATEIIKIKNEEVAYHISGDIEFNLYFENTKFKSEDLKKKTFAIIDDCTKKDLDLLITENSIVLVKHNKIMEKYSYDCVRYNKSSKRGEYIELNGVEDYYNNNIDIGRLYKLLNELKTVINTKQ